MTAMEEKDWPKLMPSTVSTGMRGSLMTGVVVPGVAVRLGRLELFFDMLVSRLQLAQSPVTVAGETTARVFFFFFFFWRNSWISKYFEIGLTSGVVGLAYYDHTVDSTNSTDSDGSRCLRSRPAHRRSWSDVRPRRGLPSRASGSFHLCTRDQKVQGGAPCACR